MKKVKNICENVDTSDFGFSLNVPLRVEIASGPTLGNLEQVI